ncbi:MAG: peptidylprolyl isomerase [Solirubrobacterales bacterium]
MNGGKTHNMARSRPVFRRVAFAVVTLALAGSLAACGGDDEGDDPTAPGTGTVAVAEVKCTQVPDEGGDVKCPTEIATDPADVSVKTSEGDFTIALDVDASPATTTSFRHLVEDGFYDGLTFSRVVPGFVIQGGDPLADDSQRAGSGGPGYYVDEKVPDDTTYDRGVVAMAKAADEPAGRSGSQFFVVSGPDAQLPPDYAYVGRVTKGLDTVAAIESLGVGDGPPRKRVTIDDMEVVPQS